MKAQIGQLVKLYYDSPREVITNDVLQTRSGRNYIVVEVHRQTRGAHIGRWHLKAIVAENVPEGARIHPIYWYKRKKRKA